MTKVMLEILDGFSLVWVLSFTVRVYTSDFKIWNWSKWILVVDILAQSLLALLTFIALLCVAKSIDISWMISLWCKILYKCLIYTSKSDQWITIWHILKEVIALQLKKSEKWSSSKNSFLNIFVSKHIKSQDKQKLWTPLSFIITFRRCLCWSADYKAD